MDVVATVTLMCGVLARFRANACSQIYEGAFNFTTCAYASPHCALEARSHIADISYAMCRFAKCAAVDEKNGQKRKTAKNRED